MLSRKVMGWLITGRIEMKCLVCWHTEWAEHRKLEDSYGDNARAHDLNGADLVRLE